MKEKKQTEEIIDIDLENNLPLKEIKATNTTTISVSTKKTKVSYENEEPLINCLRNERICIRRVPKTRGIWGNNPKHVLSGGMSENAIKVFTVPKLSNGIFVNVLTDSEKRYLEYTMGLEDNALSIYKKQNNFWSNTTSDNISTVILRKQDNYLDLSIPADYIRYKILLANKDFIAPSLKALKELPKATYEFVIIENNEEVSTAKSELDITMQCYKEFGKIEENKEKLRFIITLIEGHAIASDSTLESLQVKCNNIIKKSPKIFLETVRDAHLNTKLLILKGVELGLINNRGGFLYLNLPDNKSPLCEKGEPTLNTAAAYLNMPKYQNIKFSLEAQIKF